MHSPVAEGSKTVGMKVRERTRCRGREQEASEAQGEGRNWGKGRAGGKDRDTKIDRKRQTVRERERVRARASTRTAEKERETEKCREKRGKGARESETRGRESQRPGARARSQTSTWPACEERRRARRGARTVCTGVASVGLQREGLMDVGLERLEEMVEGWGRIEGIRQEAEGLEIASGWDLPATTQVQQPAAKSWGHLDVRTRSRTTDPEHTPTKVEQKDSGCMQARPENNAAKPGAAARRLVTRPHSQLGRPRSQPALPNT
eukprot:2457421-Rhodomonas_salina.1